MTIVSDKELKAAIKKTTSVKTRSLWQHLNGIAEYFAVIGDTEAALDIWTFAYQDIPYVPEKYHYYGDCCITALCAYLKHDDLSRGKPACQFVHPEDALEVRVVKYYHIARYQLSGHGSPLIAYQDDKMRLIHEMGRPPAAETFSSEELYYATQLDEYPFLERYFSEILAGGNIGSPGDLMLLASDIAFRHGHRDQAVNYLCKLGMPLYNLLYQMFALPTTASLAFEGEFADKSKLTKLQRRKLVDTLLAPASAAAPNLLAPPKQPTEITIEVDYSTLLFEPAVNADRDNQWDLDIDSIPPIVQASEKYPNIVALMMPPNTDKCRISVEMADAPPDWGDAKHVYAFPIRVEANPREGFPDGRTGTLFPNTQPMEIGDEGFVVPSGEYDALARFFRSGKGELGYNYRVIVSLMPRGQGKHGILKLDEFWLQEGEDANATQDFVE